MCNSAKKEVEERTVAMKKIVLVVAVLALAVPAFAEVKIYCGSQPWLAASVNEPNQPPTSNVNWDGIVVRTTWVGNDPWHPYDTGKTPIWDPNIVRVYYDANSEPNLVRAFALDITLIDDYGDANAVITSVTPAKVGESNSTSKGYGIFMGSIVIDSAGNVTDWNTPVAPSGDPCAAGPLGSNSITVELGSLYVGAANAPPKTGKLFEFKVNARACKVVITENARRGGVVMENPDESVDVNMPEALVMCPGDICASRSKPWDGVCNTQDFMKAKNEMLKVGGYEFMTADICGSRNKPPDDTVNTQDFMKAKNNMIAGTDWQ